MSPDKYSIYRMIDIIRKRPGMYIGDPSPQKLLVFLRGYMFAMQHAGLEDVSEPPLANFHDWVAAKFGFRESTAGWPSMILAVTLELTPVGIRWEGFDAQVSRAQYIKATECCFALLDEYRGLASPALG